MFHSIGYGLLSQIDFDQLHKMSLLDGQYKRPGGPNYEPDFLIKMQWHFYLWRHTCGLFVPQSWDQQRVT